MYAVHRSAVVRTCSITDVRNIVQRQPEHQPRLWLALHSYLICILDFLLVRSFHSTSASRLAGKAHEDR